MGPAQAIETCIKKSFKFSGKASRPEYWWFLPIGVLLPIAALAALQWLYPSLSSLLLGVVFLIALLPLMSVTKRRLTDSGENGVWFETPLVALVLFLAAIWAITGLKLLRLMLALRVQSVWVWQSFGGLAWQFLYRSRFINS
jgi:uncharacterized membrane protein YhaH (DUF805 family)